MTWEQIQENWSAYQESAKHAWDKLSTAQLEIVSGDCDRLVRQLEDAYGMSRADAEREVEVWQRSLH
jgi:uncharacterized protein YjbJ (UPF0337 family)